MSFEWKVLQGSLVKPHWTRPLKDQEAGVARTASATGAVWTNIKSVTDHSAHQKLAVNRGGGD